MIRVLKLLFLVPVALALIILAVSNRQPVTLSLDPLGRGLVDASLTMPLFAAILGAMMIGVLLGGVATWLLQSRHRRLERTYRREAEKLKAETDRLKAAVQPVSDLPAPLLRAR
jgi:uncharacterized integral membrane protein